jgi:hypothetical protein
MTDLFQFVALRAPVRQVPVGAIDLRTDTEFQNALSEIHNIGDVEIIAAAIDASPINRAREIAQQYVAGGEGGGFLGDSVDLTHRAQFEQFARAAAAGPAPAQLAADVQATFGEPALSLIGKQWFQALQASAKDTVVARIIVPSARSYNVADLALLIRLMALIAAVAGNEPALGEPGGVARALSAMLLLPVPAFPLRTDLPQPVGVGDLLVVRQQLIRYEAGDIANIENILRGEKRSKVNGHSLTTDTTTITETVKTTETTTSLDVTERFELKSEVANVVKEDLAVNAGLNVSAKYGTVEINANADVAYNLSKEQSTKAATDHAKDVTSRAATKVTETVRREEIARTIEKLYERESHSFDNTAGTTNVSGVYQWLNKVYQAQVFNYGKRLLYDIVVPEPAAFVRDAVSAHSAVPPVLPPEPFAVVQDTVLTPGRFVPFWRAVEPGDLGPDGKFKPGVVSRPLTPADLAPNSDSPTYYGVFMGKFGAVGVNAPPEPTVTVSKGYAEKADDKNRLTSVDDLTIPQGYEVSAIDVNGGFVILEGDPEDGNETLDVFVGRTHFWAKGNGNLAAGTRLLPVSNTGAAEQGTIPVAVETFEAADFAISVDVTCNRTDAALDQWRVDTFTAVVNGYANLMSVYQDKLKAQAILPPAASLGDNPTQNRIIERTELKKASISLLSGTDLYTADLGDLAVNDPPPAYPRPNVPPRANAIIGDQEAFLRFFEQAFEWEHMMYLFYPYYWSRRSTWYDQALADNPDPLFAEFLKAGAARVVIPVRPQLEGDLRYFLMTGQIWAGGAMPEITDTDYLPITEEIRDRDEAPGTEVPQGDPWEVTLPTTLIRLRADDTLPEWRKFTYQGRDVWVPGRTVKGEWTPDYGTLHGDGSWTPK